MTGPDITLPRAVLQQLAAEPRPYRRHVLLSFAVHGDPIGQGNIGRSAKGVAYHQNSKTLTPWRKSVAAAAHLAIDEYRRATGTNPFPLEGPVSVDYIFAMKKPDAAPKGRRTWPVGRPDMSHLIRAAEDAMHVIKVHGRIIGQVFGDDSQIVRSCEVKTYPGEYPGGLSRPGVLIRVGRVLDEEAPVGATCICGCGTSVSRQAWVPGHDSVALADVVSSFGGLVPFLSWVRTHAPHDT